MRIWYKKIGNKYSLLPPEASEKSKQKQRLFAAKHYILKKQNLFFLRIIQCIKKEKLQTIFKWFKSTTEIKPSSCTSSAGYNYGFLVHKAETERVQYQTTLICELAPPRTQNRIGIYFRAPRRVDPWKKSSPENAGYCPFKWVSGGSIYFRQYVRTFWTVPCTKQFVWLSKRKCDWM